MRPELVQATDLLRQKTPEAVEQALGLLQNTVFSFSMKMCGHREDAEDATQEVLLGSLKHLSKLGTPDELAAWLYTVTRNRCRRSRRKPGLADGRILSLDELTPNPDELDRLLHSSAKNPESLTLTAERRRHLQEAVTRLPIPLRLVLVLQDMEELTTEEVARILGLQTGTVRVRLHRARLAVRQELGRVAQGLPDKNAARNKKKIMESKKPAVKRPQSCRDLFAKLSDYIDARVEPGDCEQMREHIEGCPACVAFLNDLKAAVDRCRQLSVSCDARVAQRMRALMTQEYLRMVGVQV